MLRIYTFPKMGCLKYYRIHPNLTNHTKDQHKDHNSQLPIKIHEYPNAKIHTNKNKPQNLWGKKKEQKQYRLRNGFMGHLVIIVKDINPKNRRHCSTCEE